MFYPRVKLTLHLIGAILKFLALAYIIPLAVALYHGENWQIFLYSLLLTFIVGIILEFSFKTTREIERADGFILVSFTWLMVALLGTAPYLFWGCNFIDAFFESMSGFTTTGASVLTNIEINPRAILFWRDQIQWMGGMGIIVLLVAILPSSGIEGMQLFRAEVPGPTADKIRPTTKNTAKILWLVYMIISALAVLFLYFSGMSAFDAFTHMFGTMPTGGFAPRNLSVGAYNNPVFEGIIIVFMFIAGTKFFLNYRLLFHLDVKALIKDREFLFYVGVILISILIVTTELRLYIYPSIFAALRYASFQVVSITTTTGFVTTNYDVWPALSKNILLILMFIGGCAGSTGGAIKNVRILLLLKQAYRELYRLVHPRAVTPIRLGNEVIPEEVMRNITGFFLLYLFIFVFCTFIMAALGLDMLSAASSVAATLGNVGPGLGMVGPTKNYAFIHPSGKIVLIFCMLLGRLEIYTVLLLLIPEFWRK